MYVVLVHGAEYQIHQEGELKEEREEKGDELPHQRLLLFSEPSRVIGLLFQDFKRVE